MKILFEIISAFLYFNCVSPVQMYINDDNPTLGFVAVDGGTYMKTGYSVGKASKKQQFTGSYSNPKYQKINNEHVVDTHFKVMKTPAKLIPVALDTVRIITHEGGKNKGQRIVEEYRNTETPKQWQQKPQYNQMINSVNSGQTDIRQITQIPNDIPSRGDYSSKPKDVTSHSQTSNNQQIQPIRPKAVNVDYSIPMKQRNQDAGNSKNNQESRRIQRTQNVGRVQRHEDAGHSQLPKDGTLDSKSYVEMNVRNAQLGTEPQRKVLLNNNRQSTSLSVVTAQDKRQRIPTSMVIDKTLHKSNGIAHDHNKQVMSRVLDAMTQKIEDRRHKKGEYGNTDTEKHLVTVYEKSKRSVVADNMRKYIGKDKFGKDNIGKDIHNQQRQNSALARIGTHEESLEQDDTPYAVFYRMNPETLDRQEGFMNTRSLDAEIGSKDFVTNDKRLQTAFREDTENFKTNQNSKKSVGGTLLRKKLMNFSNYRNY